jgi:pimeloyl-ACP methyl ester carboxylesterase
MKFVVFKPRFIPGQFKKLMLAQFAPYEALLDKIFFGLADEMQNHPLNPDLSGVKVPTLIVWGRHDHLIHHTCATVQHQAIAGSELTIFEQVGHVPMIEQPAKTAAVHLPFLAKH